MVDTATLAFAGAFLLFAALLAVSLRRVLAAPRLAEAPAPPDPDSRLVAREVLDEAGQDMGETVRVAGDEVVLQRGGKFFAVPKAALREEGDKLRAEGVDWAAAEARGEAWRARQQDVMAYDDEGMPVAER